MLMYKVREIKTGLYKNRKGLWPRWGEVGTLFLTKSAAKCSVSYSNYGNKKQKPLYEIIEYEVFLEEKSKELYPKEK